MAEQLLVYDTAQGKYVPLTTGHLGLAAASTATIISASTALAGANWTDYGDVPCNSLDVVNQSGQTIEVRRGGGGASIKLLTGQARTFVGITNANQISIRRLDQANGQVVVEAEALTA